jgi:tight adherence protein B
LIYLICTSVALSTCLLTFAITRLFRKRVVSYSQNIDRHTRASLDELFVFIEVRKLVPLLLFFAVSVVVMVWVLSARWLIAFAMGSLCLLLPKLLFSLALKARAQRFEQQLPEALVSLASLLRAGLSLNLALSRLQSVLLPPLSQELGLVVREHRLGTSIDDCLAHLYLRMPLESVMVTTSLLRVALKTGGSMANMLDKHAMCIRANLHLEAKAKVLSSQGRMQAWVMGLLPLALLLALDFVAPELTRYFYDTEIGKYCLVIIVVLELLGVVLIRRILRLSHG